MYCGVDVGSTSVRLGVYGEDGQLVCFESVDVGYEHGEAGTKIVTQRSGDIWNAFLKCYKSIRALGINVKSIAVAATCSMVVFVRDGAELKPFSLEPKINDEQNVIFWMDQRAEQQAAQLNDNFKYNGILEFYGGAFTAEMGICKLKYVVDKVPPALLKKIVVFSLHEYLAFMISSQFAWFPVQVHFDTCNLAPDGDIKGWSLQFLEKALEWKNHPALFGSIADTSKTHSLPVVGTVLSQSPELTVCQGVIDCYAGWISSSGKTIQGTLTMVAGTSTCYLIAHKTHSTLPGVWGPFGSILGSGLLVSQVGQSTTGKLIEHLFETHPAAKLVPGNIFEQLEQHITLLELISGESIHFLTKHMFLYGDLAGNRCPYGDTSMRGAFIGESTDTSLDDLVLKYTAALEFLALSAKQYINLLSPYKISKITICGSQAKNHRLVQLIANVTKLPVEVSSESPENAGVKGAAMIAMAGFKKKPVASIINEYNKQGTIVKPVIDDKLDKLMSAKFQVMIDFAQTQIKYKSMVDKAIS